MSRQENFVADYERRFIDLLTRTAVSKPDGSAIGGIKEGVVMAEGLIRELEQAGGEIMFVGNGASATISSHFAVDFWKAGGVRSRAFNDSALLTCVSNDYSYEEVFKYPVEMFADEADILVAISSSGQSVNILNAADAARLKKCTVITLSGFEENNPLRRKGDLNFYVPSPSYGYVEALHTYILHCVLDLVIAEHKERDSAS